MAIIVRKAVQKDIQIIQEIEKNIYSDPWPKVLFQIMLSRANEFFFVATNEEEILGYGIGEIEREQEVIMGHVLNLAVKETWRNKGYGETLLKELEKNFIKKGATETYLEVRISNKLAQKLYTKNGFNIVDILKNYYRDEDGYKMVKKLV
jgi:ribosomal-protein-alanine N-acetyltransferase